MSPYISPLRLVLWGSLMAGIMIDIVGGPAHGNAIDRPKTSTVHVPVSGPEGFSVFAYTLRRCRNSSGKIVEVLAPAGQLIDPAYLAANKLSN